MNYIKHCSYENYTIRPSKSINLLGRTYIECALFDYRRGLFPIRGVLSTPICERSVCIAEQVIQEVV